MAGFARACCPEQSPRFRSQTSKAPDVFQTDTQLDPKEDPDMSSAQTQAPQADNEWTIMIFFAGDPQLSPSMTAQLKAIKDAGFQANTTVLLHYDPNERGVATTTFEINRGRKAEIQGKGEIGTRIGDGKDPFVRNLIEDSIPGVSRSANAAQALSTFLINGLKNHQAKHYLVFLVGHGLVVGNDMFLPDNQPESGITLKQLGEILQWFRKGANMFQGEVELVGLHSCSMSAIEVAYELQGTAKYMLATEGTAFVASWPYRQLLKKILNTIDTAIENGVEVNVDDLVTSLQQLSLHNSTDFMFSGLSADLCLASLDVERINALNSPIRDLTKALKEGMNHRRGLELITMAHLKAQSYWQETYTDLYDFCLCLERQCDPTDQIQNNIRTACKKVQEMLAESPKNVILQSDFFGPLYQYSHGLSVFFPWSRPVDDVPLVPDDDMIGRYKNYKFTTALGDDSWLSFLEEYFRKTQRDSREVEDGITVVAGTGSTASLSPNGNGIVSRSISVAEALEPVKSSPPLGDGTGCTCSVKNYPMEFLRSPRASQDPNGKTNGAFRPRPSGAVVTTQP